MSFGQFESHTPARKRDTLNNEELQPGKHLQLYPLEKKKLNQIGTLRNGAGAVREADRTAS